MGDFYLTPQYKIDALAKTHKIPTNTRQVSSEYLYEDDKGANAIPSGNHLTDEYVLPPQDRDDISVIRPRKEKKRNVEDIYDEDHYTLARNSGFGNDFNKSAARNSTVLENKPEQKMLRSTHVVIICLIFGLFAIGGVLAYVLVERIGETINC